MKRLLDPSFAYKPAVSTDVAKTIQRVRKRMQQAADTAAACEPWFNASAFGDRTNVCPIQRSRTA